MIKELDGSSYPNDDGDGSKGNKQNSNGDGNDSQDETALPLRAAKFEEP